jgi:hypothetical protein
MEVEDQLHAPGRFAPREKGPYTHCVRGWVGSRADLEVVAKRKYPFTAAVGN